MSLIAMTPREYLSKVLGRRLGMFGLLLVILAVVVAGIAPTVPVYVSEVYPSTVYTTQAIKTETSKLTTVNYRTQSSGGSPTCPYGGRYYARICTALCGCQYDVCVSFDNNCANDYKAVYVGGRAQISPYTIVYTFIRTQCTTLPKEALATRTMSRYGFDGTVINFVFVTAFVGLLIIAVVALRARPSRTLRWRTITDKR